MTRILAHTLGKNFNSFYELNQKFEHFVSLYRGIQKRKPSGGAEPCGYGCVPRRTNPLYELVKVLCEHATPIWIGIGTINSLQ